MSIDNLLAKLDKVRRTGPDSWLARCPAHDDRGPSLSVRDAGEGKTLLHCFAQCSVDDVLFALDLSIDDLFPARLPKNHKSLRRSFPAHDVLEAVAKEATLVAVAAANIRQGIVLTDADHARLLVAVERLHEARGLANGER